MSAPQIQYPPTSGGGTPVGGSGTINTIPRWTGASTLGDSIIIQGSTANAIGIGNAPTTDLAGYKALEVGGLGSGFVNADNDLWITANAKHSGGGWKYAVAASTPSNSIRANAGAIIFNRAGNGTAGNALTWLESARIDSSGNIGIGTASPNAILSVYNASTPTISLWNSSNFTRFSTNTNDCFVDVGLGGTAGALIFRRSSSATESARIDSAGRWYVGVGAVSPASSGIWAIINQPGGAGGQEWHNSTGSQGGAAIVPSQDRATWYVYSGSVGSEVYKQSCALTPTGIDLTGASATPGLKLPATPGNGNANTLDSYQEGTRVLSAGDLSGWTYVTATQYWTLVGRTVTLHTVFTGGTSSATGGATIATPPLLTPLRIAAGAAVNSAGTALGNGVCVVASTSSTTGTVTTSNAISSSAVDKVITVTYETAGL